ncbi:MAG: hypothetical protein WA956_00200 [Stenotrophomonas sp.]
MRVIASLIEFTALHSFENNELFAPHFSDGFSVIEINALDAASQHGNLIFEIPAPHYQA